QRHFRALLDSMARPGTISELERVDLTPPPHLNAASALVAFALLNADASFHLVGMSDDEAAYLATNTRAAAAPIDEAAFIFVTGDAAADVLEGINCGSLAYPDAAATMVIQVEALSAQPVAGGLELTLRGPGVADRATV